MTDEQEALEVAADIAAEIDQHKDIDSVTLSNGVRLGIKAVPGFLLRDIARKIPKPNPPIIFLDDKQRSEENPNDPAYEQALLEWFEQTNEAGLNIAFLVGTSNIVKGTFTPLVEFLPDDIPAWDSDDWIATVEYLGLTVDQSKPQAHYLAWLKYVVLTTQEDTRVLSFAVGAKSGIMSQDVEAALRTFRGGTKRGADLGGTGTPNVSENGHQLQAVDSGVGAGSGSA